MFSSVNFCTIHIRMVYDQHSGRPKGFAFCEYQDVETAQSALRNLHEQMLNGRPLKLDSAANAPDDRFKGTRYLVFH